MAYGGFKGYQDAARITGKREEDLTATDKVAATSAGIASSAINFATFGLVDIDPKTFNDIGQAGGNWYADTFLGGKEQKETQAAQDKNRQEKAQAEAKQRDFNKAINVQFDTQLRSDYDRIIAKVASGEKLTDTEQLLYDMMETDENGQKIGSINIDKFTPEQKAEFQKKLNDTKTTGASDIDLKSNVTSLFNEAQEAQIDNALTNDTRYRCIRFWCRNSRI